MVKVIVAEVEVASTATRGPFICRPSGRTHPFGVFYGENPLDFSFTLMLLEITMVILITRIVRFLLKPLKQPRVVSEIIGGMIIGPSVLGRNKNFAEYMYPDNADFVLKNIGLMGLMYFLFLSGVKMDLAALAKTGKKQWYIATFGVLVPLVAVLSFSLGIRKSLDEELTKFSSMWGVSTSLAITAFPVIYPIIREFNLLSSEIGRLALSTAIISDVVGINSVIMFEAAKQGEAKSIAALWYVISLIVVMAFIMVCVRQAMEWIIKITPEGKPVDQVYVVAILLGVLVMGFISDFFGLAIANGPLWLGLAMPLGPPLGATLVERMETVVMELLMPFSFTFVGMSMDVFSMSANWASLRPLFFMTLAGYVFKIIATILVSLFFEMPLRDALTLGLMMSLRGQVEILLFMHWVDLKMIKKPSFTMMVLLSTTMTAIATPLINKLYDPTRPYRVNRRRTIQHTPPNTELHIVAGINDQSSVASLISLLEISHPTSSSPFSVYALRLIELVGRASSVFIDHENQDMAFEYNCYNPIHNALRLFEEHRSEYVTIHPFTSVSPKRTMYQDICDLALMKKAALIILPFHDQCFVGGRTGTQLVPHAFQSLNSNVLNHAPCSVGILLDKSYLRNQPVNASRRRSLQQFAVLFLGGADAREALAYADRMAGNPNVSLTVIRFLCHDSELDDVMEKKLDDGIVTWFWVKNEGNERVVYREVVVRNGEETVAAIQAMNNDEYDLWIVGRKQGINPVLIEGLSAWSENNELGIIGDYVASVDLNNAGSVLVVHQQILRGDD